MYKHYSAAPVCVWVFPDEETIKSEYGDNMAVLPADTNFGGVIERAVVDYQRVLNEDVVPAFNEFDKDASGAIDKEELGELMKKLGNPLTENQLAEALKDLDLNKDGVVDLDEFKRWYFTGMKPYNGTRRTLLKAGGKARALLAACQDEARAILLG